MLLYVLPLAAHALGDDIVTDILKGLLLLVVGGVLATAGVAKLIALFIKTLQKQEAPAMPAPAPATTPGQIVWPTAVPTSRASRFRWVLVARVALLAVLPNLFWLYLSLSLLAFPFHLLSTERLLPNELLVGGLYALPSVVLAGWLWRNQRPSMALGIVLSSVLLATSLLAFAAGQRSKEATAEKAIIDATPLPSGPDATRVLDQADQMPTFPGGADSLWASLHRRVRYPELLRADQISGRVRLRYVVGIDGRVYSPEVTQGLGGGAFDDEALRAVQELTFEPARQNGEIVAVYDTISVMFRKPLPAHKAW
ncbi:energy transducer TonB [Hymenobacter negativus]|uniref:Energy transducer TonB n=1 Tax=Hymenobacter negativus TaxID=2795026 RepID=A0ABS3QLE4_9BACT|nr:energy transducer TonB [Hymenobacter negativus]MBO2012047.1 energy transducer TonB [Hymenobacter negativus]